MGIHILIPPVQSFSYSASMNVNMDLNTLKEYTEEKLDVTLENQCVTNSQF